MVKGNIVRLTGCAIAAIGLLAVAPGANAQKKPDRLVFISGTTGGSWYAYATGFVPIYRAAGIDATTEPGGGSVNPLRISKGDADAAYGQTSANFDATQGRGAFTKYGKIGGILNLAMLSTDHVHLVCTKDSGITTWAGIKGARLGAPSAATASWDNFLTGVEVAGLKESDLNVISRGGAETGTKMVKDRQADCVTHTSHWPIASFSELAFTRPITVIGMTKEQIAEVSKRNPGLIAGVIPKGTYSGQDKDVDVYKAGSVLMTHTKLSDDTAYWIVKVLGDKLDEVKKVHMGLAPLTLQEMARPPVFPLHPGAARYFKEKGVL
ncbi:MAG: TAXI family TRAP transporter solute-binding subunit [Proteobacteria bacterium]|nr:TAXI family TRAP transporter solute-binding subunit [Pseudomonadota bacterium]